MKRLLLLSAMALAGCAVTPATPDQAGPPPSDTEAILRAYLASTLVDPGSLSQFRILEGPTPCKLGSLKSAGWCVLYEYNAKNRLGGYAGVSVHSAIIQRDRVDLTEIVPLALGVPSKPFG